jgi:lipoprotein-anchoring transpeptidase ErfK/SrfK
VLQSIKYLSLSLVLITSAAQAQDWCGKPSKATIKSTPTPGYWYRISQADKVATEMAGQGKKIASHVFGDMAENVMRASRRGGVLAYTGALMCVPVVEPGKEWTPLPETYAPAQTAPKLFLISLKDQFLGVYAYGKLVKSVPVSTGRPGKGTPTGHFFVMQKDKFHKSSLYKKTVGSKERPWPMPNAVKFTNYEGGGLWFHEGTLPGAPDSHGCVRQFPADAEIVFNLAELNDPVEVVKGL